MMQLPPEIRHLEALIGTGPSLAKKESECRSEESEHSLPGGSASVLFVRLKRVLVL